MCNGSVSARLAVIAGCFFVIAGCSATNYSKPIQTFASATANANSALADLTRQPRLSTQISCRSGLARTCSTGYSRADLGSVSWGLNDAGLLL